MVHFSILTFGKVALVYEPRNHVAVLQIIVVMRTKYVGWYDTGKHTVMLLVVRPGGGDKEGYINLKLALSLKRKNVFSRI